uniref:Transposase (Putative), gypsy type n=1 Tax=Tanacetum cinerariifolium TaxID=118510 RepID=A0A699HBS3_TANCI|nr:hypothetical protein [Tanacetum cinerariifolium]
MGWDTIQLENAVSTISQEYLLEFTSECGIPESLHHELSGLEDLLWSFLRAKSVFTPSFLSLQTFVDEMVFPNIVDWRSNAPKDEMPSADSYSAVVVATLNTCRDDVYPTFLYDDDRGGALNPTKVKTRTRPRATHKVPVLTVTASRVIDMADTAVASGSSRTPAAIEKLPLYFTDEDPPSSTLRGKSLAAIEIEADSTGFAPATQETLVNVSDLDPLSYAKPRPISEQDISQSSRRTPVAKDLDSEESTSFTSMVGSPESIYQSRWGITNNCRLDTPAVCQNEVDHIPGYFLKLRHLPNDDFLSQYNITLAQQVEIGSQLRLMFEQEAKLLKEAVAQAEADMKVVAKAKNAKLARELESLRVQIKAAFDEFKKYEDDRVTSQCAEMDARLDALSINFDEELTEACICRCRAAWIAKGMSEGLKHGVEHRKAKVDLAAIKAYDPEADTKYVAALHALKDLKYPLVDQLDKLKDATIYVIMASLFLESDSGEDAPQGIRELHPSSSQLKILVYPEVRNLKDAWSFKEEILLEDVIATNISRSEKKKKKCRVVCRTHGVGFAHHARSNGVPVSVPIVAPQGLVILLADAATQIDRTEDEASLRLLRSKSVPPMYNLDWL